jgi:hypothetical protein
MARRFTEKRGEQRISATGTVALNAADPALPRALAGELVDISSGGFRARHSCPAFYSGLEVQFSHDLAQGRALVVWNRILGAEVESGFVILATP